MYTRILYTLMIMFSINNIHLTWFNFNLKIIAYLLLFLSKMPVSKEEKAAERVQIAQLIFYKMIFKLKS